MVLANRPDHHTHTLIWCTGEREITKRARNEIGPATGTDDTLHRLFVYTWLCFNAANEYYLLFALLVILDVELTKRISNKYRENVLMVLWFIVEENLAWTHRYNNDDTGWRRWGRCDGQQFGVVAWTQVIGRRNAPTIVCVLRPNDARWWRIGLECMREWHALSPIPLNLKCVLQNKIRIHQPHSILSLRCVRGLSDTQHLSAQLWSLQSTSSTRCKLIIGVN